MLAGRDAEAKRIRARNGPLITLALFIFTAAMGLMIRFFKISYHFSENGTDEGIQLMASRLMSEGYTLYLDFNTLQAPLFQGVYSLFGGDLIMARSLSALLGVLGILAVMFIVHRYVGKWPALFIGVLMCFESYHLKESRLASLDMGVTTLLVLAFLFLFLTLERDSRYRRYFAVVAGVFFALASMTKLFAVIPMGAVYCWLLLQMIMDRRREGCFRPEEIRVMAIIPLSVIISVAAILIVFGPVRTIDGMLLSNLEGRAAQDLLEKLGNIGTFLLLDLGVLILALISMQLFKKERLVRLSLVWLLSLTMWFALQPITWDHHMTLLVPPLFIMSGVGVNRLFTSMRGLWDGRRFNRMVKGRSLPIFSGILLIAIVVGFLTPSIITVATVERPVEYDVGRELASITDEDDWILSGDPLIPLLADRLQVPDAVNLAQISHPKLMDEDLIDLCEEYGVSTVVITYRISELTAFKEYVQTNFTFIMGYLEDGTEGPDVEQAWGYRNFLIYQREVVI